MVPNTEPLPVPDGLPLRWVRVSHKTPDHIAERYLYAGYGSNLALVQMGKRCPGVDIIGPGILRGARIVFAYHMGIVQDDNATVPIGVYKCTAADVAALDRYEALGRKYERILVTVECNGVAVRCFTYLKKDNNPDAPTESYYQTCLTGYNDWQFDTRRLRHAREHAVKHAPVRKPSKAVLPYWYDHVAGSYRSDEPLGNNTAADYNRAEIARAQRRNARGPRPVGGRLGGAEFADSRIKGRLDERLSVADFKAQVEAMRVKPVEPAAPKTNGAAQDVFLGRDGQRWIKNPKGNGWIRKID